MQYNNRIRNFNTYDYLSNRRLSIIEKSKKQLYTSLQVLNNEVLDAFIYEYHDERYDNQITNKEYIFKRAEGLNSKHTNQFFARLLDNSILRKDMVNRIQTNLASNRVNTLLTNTEVERIFKNIAWAEQVINNTNFRIDTYKQLSKKLSPASSRKLLIEKSIEDGASARTGREYSYKELKNVARNLEKYKVNSLDLETRKLENYQCIRDGAEPINQTKTWVWSTLENTRHQLMDGQTVPLESKFEVINETDGTVDYLLFPGDFDNELHNCSNTCNCRCSILYNTS